MGTRADFYLGRGSTARWLCSIGWDGYPEGVADAILDATDQDAFLTALDGFLEERDDVSNPGTGWPWPWDDSRTTDYAYAFDDDDKVWISRVGRAWVSVAEWRSYGAAWEAWSKRDDARDRRLERGEDATVIEAERAEDPEPEDPTDGEKMGEGAFPDMTKAQNVTLGQRSGLIVVIGRER